MHEAGLPAHAHHVGGHAPAKRGEKTDGGHSWCCSAGHVGGGVGRRGRGGPLAGGFGRFVERLVVVDRHVFWVEGPCRPRHRVWIWPSRSTGIRWSRRAAPSPYTTIGGIWLGDRRRRRRLRPALIGGTGDYALADGTDAAGPCRRDDSATVARITTPPSTSATTISLRGSPTAPTRATPTWSETPAAGPAATTPPSTSATTRLNGGTDGAFAGAGGLTGGVGDGNNDTAVDIGNNSGSYDGSFADEGNGNYASVSGSTTGVGEYAYAGQGNDNTAVADTSYNTNYSTVDAAGGNDNYASVLGPENSHRIRR